MPLAVFPWRQLAEVCKRFNWWGHAYCLRLNHYHLLLETPDANLSKGMRQLNGVYTRRFIAEGIGQPGPWEQLKQQVFLGSDAFVDEPSRRVPKDRDLSEAPLAQRRPAAKLLAECVSLYPDRDQAVVAAYASGGYTLKKIGDDFGLHSARLRHIVRVAKEAKGKI